jgi:hypothetical protein
MGVVGGATQKSPALRGFIARRPCGLPGWGLAINVGVEKPPNHALVLRVVFRGLGLEELDALLAQSQSYLHTFFTKCQVSRRREEVRDNLNLAKGFIGVFDFSSG